MDDSLLYAKKRLWVCFRPDMVFAGIGDVGIERMEIWILLANAVLA